MCFLVHRFVDSRTLKISSNETIKGTHPLRKREQNNFGQVNGLDDYQCSEFLRL